MSYAPCLIYRLRALILGGLCLALALPSFAQDAAEKIPAPVAGARVLNLAECLQIGYDKQPSLVAARASLAAAQDQQTALDNLARSPAGLLVPDLAIRRQQACIGVEIAEASVRQTEQQVKYNITRLYYTVVYARAQLQVADEVAQVFGLYQGLVGDAIKQKGAPKDWTSATVDRLVVYRGLAENKKEEAADGINRALSALKEAMGSCEDIDIQAKELPELSARLVKCEIVAMADALRPELVMAAKFVDLTNLEVEAQGKHRMPGQIATFAQAGDIHARQIPQDRSNADYHPGGIPPEMPATLVGSRTMRMERAKDFSARAAAVSEKTRKLIILEAENAYFEANELRNRIEGPTDPTTGKRIGGLRDAARAGGRMVEETPKDVAGLQKVKIEDLLTNLVLGSQARGQYNEALWRSILALASLERVTAGGFCADFTPPAKAK
jgi:hypothetical protein